MKIKIMPPAGNFWLRDGWKTLGPGPSRSRRRPPLSRADQPCRLKREDRALDPARPARFTGWRDDGDGTATQPGVCAHAPLMKGRKMHTDSPGKKGSNDVPAIPESGIVAYNLREGERPGGLKVRFKVTIVTGDKARELDARQAEAIRRLLQWAQQNQHSPHQT